MKEVIEKNKCCGCHACYSACPKGAITMCEDEAGFKYPVIDKKKCINCKICKIVCPSLNNKKEEKKEVEAYAAYNKKSQERKNSSSGGLFILIAKQIIKMNGVVFGASFDENFEVIHSFSETEEDLKKFMGSKYVQSSINDTYKNVKRYLDSDRYVLFSGTPCQIEGLKSFLRKDYEKLYTQDIICHGVPSPKVWRRYLAMQSKKYNDKIKSISFRNKDKSWSLFSMKIIFSKNKYRKDLYNDLYMRFFLNNLCLRKSCYNCDFKKKYRNSDITLADYWGINNMHKKINDEKGVSLIILNTKKGKEIFDLIKKDLVYIETNLDTALKNNISMIQSVIEPQSREKFIAEIDNPNFEQTLNKFLPQRNTLEKHLSLLKKKIKILFRL